MSYADQYVAVASTGVYFAGLSCFKTAAGRMPELRGARPVHLAVTLTTDGMWLSGSLILMSGVLLQLEALGGLTLLQAEPLFMSGLIVLLALALLGRGERLGRREWTAVLLLTASTALIASSMTGSAAVAGRVPAPEAVLALAVPSLLLPTLGFIAADVARKGTHRRPLNGVALAVSVGLLTGTAELMLKGMADRWTDPRLLLEGPQLYLFLAAAPLALGQMQIALQRCRLAIVGLVATATAKAYLVVGALAVHREPPPDRWAWTLLGFALAVLAVAMIPRHAHRARTYRAHHTHRAGNGDGPARPAPLLAKERWP